MQLPEQHDLIGIFEAEPRLSDPDVPWSYNCLTFVTDRGPNRVVCEISPGYDTVRLNWFRDGTEVVRLELAGVRGVATETERGREEIVLSFRDERLLPLRLQLKPRVHLSWGAEVGERSSQHGV